MKHLKSIRYALSLVLALVLMLGATSCACALVDGSDGKKQTTVTTESPVNMITIAADGQTAYVIVQPTRDAMTGVSGVALGVRSLFFQTLGISGVPLGNDSKAAVQNEIVVGNTTRPETASVAARIAAMDESSFYYVVAEMDGKVILYASHTAGYERLLEYFVSTYVNGTTLAVPEDCFDVQSMTWTAYEEELARIEAEKKAQAEAERAARLEAIKAECANHRLADFGRITQLVSPYDAPHVYPTKGEHPRLLFNESNLVSLRETLASAAEDPTSEYYSAYKMYIAYSERETDGKLRPGSGDHNVDYDILTAIEAKAFRYALSGEEYFGYEAINCIKNYLLTLDQPEEIVGDVSRAYGQVMSITACVYDWCYDLLTRADQAHLTAGIMSLLAPHKEIGFPPSEQGVITGHGTEEQLLRDWISVAIATYDEYPEIYEYVAGRICEQFPDANEFYLASGSHWQGSAYGQSRYNSLLLAQIIFDRMSHGSYRLFSENLARPFYTFLNYYRPDGEMLRIGDDYNEKNMNESGLVLASFFSSVLYGDELAKWYFKNATGDFARFFTSGHYTLTPVMFLVLNNSELGSDKDISTLPLVHYNGSPLGSIIARTAWEDDDAIMVYMKIGEAYSANHEHKDAGTFHIYYHGILASDSGYHDQYNSVHDTAYTKQTISHNSLLIYNPNLPSNGRWIYSGGQTVQGNANYENRTLAEWLAKKTSHQAEIIGYDYATSDDGSEYLWSYLAGDLTNAYDAVTVDEVSRYMISVMTGDADRPMAFIVYDRITSVDASFKKTFLLHTQQEPSLATTVDGKAYAILNATAEEKYSLEPPAADAPKGKLWVQSVGEAVEYTLLGGEDAQFIINGENYGEFSRPLVGDVEAGWGRLEISPAALEKTNRLLTVMYVTDGSYTEELAEAIYCESDLMLGAEILGSAVFFPKNAGSLAEEIRLTAGGGETLDYYVVGLAPGPWSVSVNGEKMAVLRSEPGRGVLSFNAPSGEVTLTPAFSTITYDLGGGQLTESTIPETYDHGVAYELPIDVTKLGSRFGGWYTDPNCEEQYRITEISGDAVGHISLYVKWIWEFDVITYVTGSGKIRGDYSIKYDRGTAYRLPTDVVKVGSEFVGWYTDPNYSRDSYIEVIPETHTGDITLYARYLAVYANADMSSTFPEYTGVSFNEGIAMWDGMAKNGQITVVGDFCAESGDTALTIAFDLIRPEGKELLDFSLRLRPVERNVIETTFFSVTGGVMSVNNTAIGTLGDRVRVTIVLDNSNAGVAKGMEAMASGALTTSADYYSPISIKVYLDGCFAYEGAISKNRITFGVGFDYNNGTVNPFSTQLKTIQFYKSKNEEKCIGVDNLVVADGALLHGEGVYFDLGGARPVNGNHLSDGKVIAFPTLTPPREGDFLEGWYTSPDFAGSPVTSLDGIPSGTILYAKWNSNYGHIVYEMGDAEIEGEYSTYYIPGTPVSLPTNVIWEGRTFLGWYTSQDYTTKIETLNESEKKTVTLYARYRTVYANADMTSTFPAHTGVSFDDGIAMWDGMAKNGQITVVDDFCTYSGDASLTIAFDLIRPEGKELLDFSLRLRPVTRNVIETTFFSVTGGVMSVNNTAIGTLDDRVRITIVLDNSNAGIAKGMEAAASGALTTSADYYSPISIKVYLDGCFAYEDVISKNRITFGAGFNYNNGTVDPFSTQLKTIQFYNQKNVEKYVGLDNLVVADGALLHGEGVYLDLGGARPANDNYLSDGKIIALPTLTPPREGDFLDGWYTSPDFAGSPVTSLDGIPSGTVLYAKWSSLYGDIVYEMGDAVIEGEYPTYYIPGTPLSLPTNVIWEGRTFLGWYTSPDYTTKIETLNESEKKTVTLYARYRTVYANADMSSTSSADTGISFDKGISIQDGVLVLDDSVKNSQFTVSADFMKYASERTLTVSFDLAKNGTAEPADINIRFRAAERNLKTDTVIFSLVDGVAKIGKSVIATLGEEAITVKLVISCDNAGLASGTSGAHYSSLTVKAYVNGDYITEQVLKTYLTFGESYTYVQAEKTTPSSMRVLHFYAPTGNTGSLLLDNILVTDGEE